MGSMVGWEWMKEMKGYMDECMIYWRMNDSQWDAKNECEWMNTQCMENDVVRVCVCAEETEGR